MKLKLFFFLLIPFLGISQVQIGQDFIGDTSLELLSMNVLSDDGKVLAVKAQRKTIPNPNNRPLTYVRVYRNVNGVWTQLGQDIDGESFGQISLSAEGTVLAIGAPQNNIKGTNSGQVKVFHLNALGNWVQKGQDINGLASDDFNGISVSISANGNILVIGACADVTKSSTPGFFRVFSYNAGNWMQIGNTIYGNSFSERYGYKVSLAAEGNVLAVSGYGASLNGLTLGRVSVYKNVGQNWVQVGQDIWGKQANELFGYALSISADGNTVGVGDHLGVVNGVISGLARVYQNIGNTWQQVGQDIGSDLFIAPLAYNASWISLSGDGKSLIVGNGSYNSPVKVYKNIGNSWFQLGSDIVGVQQGDKNGSHVSISRNVNIIAVGSSGYDKIGENSNGMVRVFDLTKTASSNKFVLDNFNIYPNPASDILNISLESNLVFEKAVFYNNLGQIVKEANQEVINVGELAKGIYYVEVTTNQGKATKKVIIK